QQRFPTLTIRRCVVADYEDIRDVVTENGIDTVFNMAVIPLPLSLVKPEWTIKKNIDMTMNICRLQREGAFQKLIQFSSSEAYGSAKTVPMSETHPLDPKTPYAASKAATDHISLSYHHTFGCDISVVRPFNQYGPRQHGKKYSAIIPATIGRMMRNEEIIIFGDGEQTRDFLYVQDTADAAIEIAQGNSAKGRVINVASGKEITMNHVVKKIAELLDYTKSFSYKEARPGDVRRHCADTTLLQKELLWEPKVSFDQGIKRTVDWAKCNPGWF
ncbi:MAG: GDP-mannose 4,6-dehydratase, partial [Nanoarchaeota archaeon]|nr:GDP-mannose 4,6-dehydratase [Nanoarchaeota archaeon]